MGAASKGIIQRGYQHNATVYSAPYARNPFDHVTDTDIDEYRRTVERKQRPGDCECSPTFAMPPPGWALWYILFSLSWVFFRQTTSRTILKGFLLELVNVLLSSKTMQNLYWTLKDVSLTHSKRIVFVSIASICIGICKFEVHDTSRGSFIIKESICNNNIGTV